MPLQRAEELLRLSHKTQAHVSVGLRGLVVVPIQRRFLWAHKIRRSPLWSYHVWHHSRNPLFNTLHFELLIKSNHEASTLPVSDRASTFTLLTTYHYLSTTDGALLGSAPRTRGDISKGAPHIEIDFPASHNTNASRTDHMVFSSTLHLPNSILPSQVHPLPSPSLPPFSPFLRHPPCFIPPLAPTCSATTPFHNSHSIFPFQFPIPFACSSSPLFTSLHSLPHSASPLAHAPTHPFSDCPCHCPNELICLSLPLGPSAPPSLALQSLRLTPHFLFLLHSAVGRLEHKKTTVSVSSHASLQTSISLPLIPRHPSFRSVSDKKQHLMSKARGDPRPKRSENRAPRHRYLNEKRPATRWSTTCHVLMDADMGQLHGLGAQNPRHSGIAGHPRHSVHVLRCTWRATWPNQHTRCCWISLSWLGTPPTLHSAPPHESLDVSQKKHWPEVPETTSRQPAKQKPGIHLHKPPTAKQLKKMPTSWCRHSTLPTVVSCRCCANFKRHRHKRDLLTAHRSQKREPMPHSPTQ